MDTILVLTGIGCALGALIFVVSKVLPPESDILKRTEEIAEILPGMNCGACGYPGCFAYAQALAANPNTIFDSPCTVTLQDPEKVRLLEQVLGVTLDASAMARKALVRCGGNSEIIYQHCGSETCKGAVQRLRGYKKCPFACLGLGDCVKVCPQDAISLDQEKKVAVVDWEKCTGCGLCVAECPQNIIELVPADTKVALLCSYTPLKNIPGRERCDFGCVHCKKCFRACEYEAITWNEEKLIPEFDAEKCTLCRKCIEECPQNCLAEVTREKVAVPS